MRFKFALTLFVILLVCAESQACHRGLFSRFRANHRQTQYAPQQNAPVQPPFVAPPKAAQPVPQPVTITGSNNCVNGNCSGPTTIQRGGLLFRRR